MSDMSYTTKENTKFMIVQGGEKKFMKKILSVALSTAMAFSMFASVAFADTATTPEAQFSALAAKGILNGFPDGQAHLEKDLTRAEFAKIIAKLFDLSEITTTLSYKDKNYNANHWARGYIEAVTKAGLMNGRTATTFDPSGKVTVQEVATVLARALKLGTPTVINNTASAWAKTYVQAVIDKGLIASSTNFQGNANRALVVSAAYAVDVMRSAPVVTSAEATSPTSVVVTFADKTTATVTPATALVEGVETTVAFKNNGFDYSVKVTLASAKVLSFTPVNATQVEVKFNRSVDETAAKTLANYKIGTTSPTSVSLSGNTATLTFALAADVEVTNAVAVVEPITLADNADKKTAKFTTVLTYEDTVKPVISSVSAKTNTTAATKLTVTVSEPIQSATAKVDGTYYSVVFGGTNTGTITGLNLSSTANHTLELVNLTDKSGNVTVTTSQAFSVTVDTVAPTATLSAYSDRAILVTFSKDMDEATVATALATSSAVKDELLAPVPYTYSKIDNKKYLLTVNTALFASKTSRTLSVVIAGSVKDDLGNAYVAGSQAVTLSKDTVKPVATGFKVVKNSDGKVTDVVITFSEALKANATPAKPVIVNMNGVIVTGSLLGGFTADPIVAGDKQVTYSVVTAAAQTGSFAFSFPSSLVTDMSEAANTSDVFNYTVDFGGGSTTFSLTSAAASANVITVNFGTAVKGGAVANSATDVANYTLAGKPLPAGTTIYLDGDQKIATITLPSGTIAATDPTSVLTVANVAATNGATLNTYTGTVAVVDNMKPVLTTAALTSDNKLVLGFDEKLTVGTAVYQDFVVKINGNEVTGLSVATIGDGSGSDSGKVVLNLGGLVKYNGTVTYIDLNNDGSLNGSDIKVADGDITATFTYSSSAYISGVTVTTAATTAGKDAQNNTIKTGVTVTAK
ncbi:S-layer homology domain-containing protein [Paenibacillus wynnii]|uniref:S-layer homology domain-containing protein n=1 Tax=Paenibacillus wynnii TaxID=268407 RepID=UPI00068D237A|nr:S-layer homology domain-containing protein [Paenibacillus wynnii]